MEANFGWPRLEGAEQPWGERILTLPSPDAVCYLPDLVHPAGDVNASLHDYVRFAQLHLRGIQEREGAVETVGSSQAPILPLVRSIQELD